GFPAEIAPGQGADNEIAGGSKLAIVMKEEGRVSRQQGIDQWLRIACGMSEAIIAHRYRAASREIRIGPVAEGIVTEVAVTFFIHQMTLAAAHGLALEGTRDAA